MADQGMITGWLSLAFGLYALAAGIGEFRWPGGWARMLWELKRSKTLQFLIGFVVFALGTAVYLVNPLVQGDVLSVVITIFGGCMMLEGLAFLAFPDWMLKLSSPMMGSKSKFFPALSALIGLAFIIAAYVRFQI